MKNLLRLTFILALVTFASCKKEEPKPEPVPIESYTVTLDLRPTDDAFTEVDNSKSIFLNFGIGRPYTAETAVSKSQFIDIAVYDGTTTSLGTGNIMIISPFGANTSLKDGKSKYKYNSLDSTENGVDYYDLLGMDEWTAFNTTKIRNKTGMGGMTAEAFNNIKTVEDFNKAVFNIQQPGNNEGDYAQVVYENGSMVSDLFYFEYQSENSTKVALALIKEVKEAPNGKVTLEFKKLP